MIVAIELLFALAFLFEGLRLRSRRVALTGLGLLGIVAVEVAILVAYLARSEPYPEIPIHSALLALAAVWLITRGRAASRNARSSAGVSLIALLPLAAQASGIEETYGLWRTTAEHQYGAELRLYRDTTTTALCFARHEGLIGDARFIRFEVESAAPTALGAMAPALGRVAGRTGVRLVGAIQRGRYRGELVFDRGPKEVIDLPRISRKDLGRLSVDEWLRRIACIDFAEEIRTAAQRSSEARGLRNTARPAFGDFDGDGWLDAAALSERPRAWLLSLFRGDANGGWTLAYSREFGEQASSLAFDKFRGARTERRIYVLPRGSPWAPEGGDTLEEYRFRNAAVVVEVEATGPALGREAAACVLFFEQDRRRYGWTCGLGNTDPRGRPSEATRRRDSPPSQFRPVLRRRLRAIRQRAA